MKKVKGIKQKYMWILLSICVLMLVAFQFPTANVRDDAKNNLPAGDDTFGKDFEEPILTGKSDGLIDWWNSSWQFRTRYRINSSYTLKDVPVSIEVDFNQILADLGENTSQNPFIPESLRVLEIQGNAQHEIPYELVDLGNGNYTVEWQVNGTIDEGECRDYFLYYNNTGTSWSKPKYYDVDDYYDPDFIDP
ncbi:MAG: hypothetical protein ACTSWN_03205, partial [Promethearchaeota archaeon]